ncbi:hypothetical protein C8R47DRAFT_1230266 [Mycena vitilis]|nr:hypothetical protein C8R47DRAFT_1230266 [Mycena vitilis]
MRVLNGQLKAQQKARKQAYDAAMRETRFRKAQGGYLAQCTAFGPAPEAAAIQVAAGRRFDANLIEDRDYDLDEVVGPTSRFHLRLIPWFANSSRPVVSADKRLGLFLGGRPRDRYWVEEVVVPATAECAQAADTLYRTDEERSQGPPVLSGGVGYTFNEEEASVVLARAYVLLIEAQSNSPRAAYGSVLNVLIFFHLFTSIAMMRLVGYGNRLLETYCSVAFIALRAQKAKFLDANPAALYPTESSLYSAATFEFGDPHRRTSLAGTPDRHDAQTWNILTALGDYKALHGGHLIVWDLGFVIAFPVGATILIPAGLLRYSFVKVRPGERRYSLLQWAGAGIDRWLRNGSRSDLDFAVNATREEHAAREARRARNFDMALATYPFEEDLEEGIYVRAPFFGTIPRAGQDDHTEAASDGEEVD